MKKIEYLDESLDLFYEYTKFPKTDFKILFTDNIYDEKVKLAVNEGMSKDIILKKDFFSNLTGSVVFPDLIDGDHTIIISNRSLNGNYEYLRTIIHELTHIYDHIYMLYYNNIDSYEDMNDLDYI